MLKYLITAGLLWLSIKPASAFQADSSYSIASAKDVYQYSINPKLSTVEIQNVTTTNYITHNYQVKIPVYEMYNDHIAISDVVAKVDGRALRGKPEYSYYSVNDVFYSDARVCFFDLSVVKKGGTASSAFTKVIDDPRYFTTVYFPERVKVAQKDITFIIPRWMKAELKEMNFGVNKIRKTVSYDAKLDADITTYTASNLPAMQREENCPGPSYLYPHVMILNKQATVGGTVVKYFATLDDQYAWYRKLIGNAGDDNTAANARAKEITAGLSTDMEKIKAIFYYVQDNIRYIAFEDGLAGFKPEKADEVLRRKYGDCKGMANLTKNMLTALGYDARLCWLGTNHIAYNYQTPSLAVDNHMICGLVYKGKTYYLDATETYIGFDEYAERIQGRQVLMENGDKFVLSTVPLATPAQNFEQETSKLTLQGTTLTGSVNHVWKGEGKEMVLTGLNSVKKEKTDEAVKSFLANGNSDYVINGLTLSSTSNPDKDLTAAYNVELKNGVSVFSNDHYVDLDRTKELLNSAITLAERKHDYWFSHKMNINKEVELTIPANLKVAGMPEALDIVNPDYEFKVKYTTQAGKLIYKKSILIKNPRIAAAKFSQWNADIERLAKAYNESVMLKPVSQ